MNETLITCPPWLVMWLLAAGCYFSFKVVILWKARVAAPAAEIAAWLLLCPTFSISNFHRRSLAPRAAVLRLALAGMVNFMFGAVLLWGVARHLAQVPMLAAWVGMVGLIFVLHFGSFHLVTAFWMQRGRAVEPLMKNPIAAGSLADFWGRRWNTAFRDGMNLLVFRPVAMRRGVRRAHWLVFLFSGLLHEAVISLPAGAGWGGPTTYFLLQALGMDLSRRLHLREGWVCRVWTLVFLILPAGLLFHPPFIHHVMLPFLKAIVALP